MFVIEKQRKSNLCFAWFRSKFPYQKLDLEESLGLDISSYRIIMELF